METLLKCIHIFAALFLIFVVLLQSGRGGGMGAAFGGAGGQIFGGRGAGNFLTRVTSGAAIVFFLTSLTLSMISSKHRSVLAGQRAPEPQSMGSDEAPDAHEAADAHDVADRPSADQGAPPPAASRPKGAAPATSP